MQLAYTSLACTPVPVAAPAPPLHQLPLRSLAVHPLPPACQRSVERAGLPPPLAHRQAVPLHPGLRHLLAPRRPAGCQQPEREADHRLLEDEGMLALAVSVLPPCLEGQLHHGHRPVLHKPAGEEQTVGVAVVER